MKKWLSLLLAVAFASVSLSAVACGDKAKDDKQMSTPATPGTPGKPKI